MLKGRTNVYVCQNCGRRLTTIDRDEGTTPFMLECDPQRTPGGCGGSMHSSWYSAVATQPATHEWYKPTAVELDEECQRYDFAAEAIREHVKRGGLLIRAITSTSTETVH